MTLKATISNNLLSYMNYYNYQDYESFSEHIGVNVNTFKCWTSLKRSPSLSTLDKISDRVNIPTYYLFKSSKNFKINHYIKETYIPNCSRKILSTNLNKIFINKNKYSWNDRSSLFYGYFSIDTLMSYTREKNPRTPPIEKISLLAECLGIEPYKLLMKGSF